MIPARHRRRFRSRQSISVAVAAEVCEQRAMLSRVAIAADFGTSGVSVLQSTTDSTFFVSSGTGESGMIDVRTLDHSTGLFSQPQRLKGSANAFVSDDGLRFTTLVQSYNQVGQYQSSDIYFYRRSGNGPFTLNSHQSFPAAQYPVIYSMYRAEAGAYVGFSSGTSAAELWFVYDSEVLAPQIVGSKEDYRNGFYVTTTSSGDFLHLGGSSPRLLNQGGTQGIPGGLIGTPGSPWGLPGDRPVALSDSHVVLTRQINGVFRVISINRTTGAEAELAVELTYSNCVLATKDGPGGKMILLLTNEKSLIALSTDGTTAGTTRYMKVDDAANSDRSNTPSAVYLSGTQRLIANWGTTELWSLNLATGRWDSVVDTNPYGDDQISTLTAKGGEAWFFAAKAQGTTGLYRTNGIETVNEFDCLENSQHWITGNEASTWVMEHAWMSMLPGYYSAVYKVRQDLPDLSQGPTNVKTSLLTTNQQRRLQVEWSPTAGATGYEVALIPWREGKQYVQGVTQIYNRTVTTGLSAEFGLDAGGYYGWHTVQVRAIFADGTPTQWTSSRVAFTDPLTVPKQGQLFQVSDQLRFGYSSYDSRWYQLVVQVRRLSDHVVVHEETPYSRFTTDLAGSPFPASQSSYYYLPIPSLADGEYSITFRQQYVDPNPTIEDHTLPASEMTMPLTLSKGAIVRTPADFKVDVQKVGVEFSWRGTPYVPGQGFELWVSDLTRGTVGVINQTVQAQSFLTSLPNGRYRAFVGLKEPGGRTVWTPAKEFTVATSTPQLINAVVQSTNARPTFRWTGSSKFSYQVWVADLSTGKRVLMDTVAGKTEWSPATPLPTGRYAIWVRELVSDTVSSNWSSRHIFVQLEPAIEVTGGLNPGLDQRPVISWTGRSDATSYEIWINRAGTPGAVYSATRLTRTSHRLGQAIGNGVFTVWVRAVLPDGRTTSWGPGATMTIGGTPVVSAIGTTLTWTAVSTATGYEVWVNYEGGAATKQAKILHLPSLKVTILPLPADELPKGLYRAWVRAIMVDDGTVYAGPWSVMTEVHIV
ncbi:MAG: hypothetical protein JNM43_07680 [Planctomycetaceae bacterium]|nr:hypothetical protein [Planctomycetaceae bacterium]